MQFAQKKEVRDRLKEFDVPDIANYIDPETIDKINKTHKTPLLKKSGSKKKSDQGTGVDVRKENQERILKMRELYGLFVQMQGQEDVKIYGGET